MTPADQMIFKRHLGSMLGLATADALGTTLEFSTRDSLPYQTEMTGGGPFKLPIGCWTDDTSMALAMAESLVHANGFNPENIMKRFVNWRDWGMYSPTGECFDIGTTVSRALNNYEATGNAYAGGRGPENAGNGALMRLAPVVLFARKDTNLLVDLADKQSRLTHGAPESIESCQLMALMVADALNGKTREDVMRTRTWGGEAKVAAIAAGEWRGKSRDEIKSTGYVIDTLEAALWCVDKTDSFEQAVILAVNLGGDADTIGAVTGQLAGAIYGLDAIPERWLAPLAWKDDLMSVAGKLYTLGNAPGAAPVLSL